MFNLGLKVNAWFFTWIRFLGKDRLLTISHLCTFPPQEKMEICCHNSVHSSPTANGYQLSDPDREEQEYKISVSIIIQNSDYFPLYCSPRHPKTP